MAKVICALYMPHHSRFLMPVVEKLKERGHDTLYVTTASDFPFERDAIKQGLKCPLIQEYTSPEIQKRIDRNKHEFFKLWSERVFTLNACQQWPMASSANLMECAIGEYEHIEEMFRIERPSLFIQLHERNRWGKLYGHLCAKYRIPYLTFQEGDYYEDRLSFSVHTEFTSSLLAWGQHTKDRLVKLGCDANKIKLCGNTHLENVMYHSEIYNRESWDSIKDALGIPKNKKIALFLVGIQWAVRHNAPEWKNILSFFKDNKEWHAVVKWHPKVTFNSYQVNIEPFMKKTYSGCSFLQNFDVYKLIPWADWCVALGKTTSAVEALCWGKPLLSCKGFDKDPDDLSDWKVAQPLNIISKENYECFNRPLPLGIVDGSEKFLENYFYKRNKEAISIAVAEAERLINEPYQSPVDFAFEGRFLQSINESLSLKS